MRRRGGSPRWARLRAVLGAVLVLGALATGCDDAPPDDPEEVAGEFWTAMCERDFATAHGFLSAREGTRLPSEDEFVTTMRQFHPRTVGAIDPACQAGWVVDFEAHGDSEGTAVLRLSAVDGADATFGELPMLVRDGRWHVHVSAVLDLE